MADLRIDGRSVDGPAAVRPLSLADRPLKSYYWLDPSAPDGGDESKKWATLTIRMKRKDEKLQELLTTPVDIKRRKVTVADRRLFEPSPYPLPTYRILSDIYKSQSKTLEDMKDSLFGSYAYDKSPVDLFDLSILYPYMSNAYKTLYAQHLDNLREISKNFKPPPTATTNTAPADKKKITIRGVDARQPLDD